MRILRPFKLAAGAARRMLGLGSPPPSARDFEIPAGEALALAETVPGDLAKLFFANTGPPCHKWLHYLPIYERYFARYRGSDFKMLEIGVFAGGSLAMWRDYFGPAATLFGIDINPACANHADPPNQVRIGSQDDPAFLRKVVAEMGGIDMVIDDGSHVAKHQRASFEILFPLLSEGGLYVIEDLFTSYWRGRHGGGYRRRGSAIELLKRAVDDLHHWHHRRGFATAARDSVAAVHFHDSIAIVEKAKRPRPTHAKIGRHPSS